MIPPVYPYFRDEVKEARKGLRFPFFGTGPTQFCKNACQFPCVHKVNFAVFTSEGLRAPDRVNMGQLGRQKSGGNVVPSGPPVRDHGRDHTPYGESMMSNEMNMSWK